MMRIILRCSFLFCLSLLLPLGAFAADYWFDTSGQAEAECTARIQPQDAPLSRCVHHSEQKFWRQEFYSGSISFNRFYYRDDYIEPPRCSTDVIAGGPVMGGSGAGVYDVAGCAYTCGTNYSLLDGNTSLHDAQECVGTGQEYVSSDPSDYSEPPSVCTVKDSLGACLDMDKQQGGVCPAGTTYGRLNDKEVCVPSGTSPDPLDPGSQGLPDQGGDMQAEGTPDRAGTGGSSTGTGTGSSSGTSTTTDNGDGTSTTVSTETKETNGPSTVRGHGDPASWWESNYPEGAAGIASKFSADIGNGPFMSMLDPLKALPANGSEPSWSMDMQVGSMGSFGSVSLELPSGVWAFVRFAILFTAVMTVRKLIFGG